MTDRRYRSSKPVRAIRAGSGWWEDALGYEVYLPSFADSNGDGWGDLRGATSKLDYLQWLGIDLLWLTPFYVSPMRDHGYDIADYRDVDPRFGSLDDLDRLIAEAHTRGIRVISDLVVNHTSREHPWFQAAREDRDGYRDYYFWRPGRDGGPPNNWVSHFGGPAWTLDPQSGEWYLHLFTSDQPDLNWGNPEVADEVDTIMRFWLDRAIDGFRIDTAHYLAKDPGLPDNPLLRGVAPVVVGGGVADWYRYDHVHDIGQPALAGIHRRWRRLADEYNAFLVGETYLLDPALLAGYLNGRDGLHSYFYFGLVQTPLESTAEAGKLIEAAVTATPHLAWVQSSHDWPRAVTRYGGGPAGAARALALATLMIGLPGTHFLYQGDELGLGNGHVPREFTQDPLALIGGAHHISRDPSRTPMPWQPEPGLGFTTARAAWLPFGDRQPNETVSAQVDDFDSLLQSYRRLHAARRALGTLGQMPAVWLDAPPGVTCYRRGNVLVAANLNQRSETLRLPAGTEGWPVLFASSDAAMPTGSSLGLPPESSVILAADVAAATDVTNARQTTSN